MLPSEHEDETVIEEPPTMIQADITMADLVADVESIISDPSEEVEEVFKIDKDIELDIEELEISFEKEVPKPKSPKPLPKYGYKQKHDPNIYVIQPQRKPIVGLKRTKSTVEEEEKKVEKPVLVKSKTLQAIMTKM